MLLKKSYFDYGFDLESLFDFEFEFDIEFKLEAELEVRFEFNLNLMLDLKLNVDLELNAELEFNADLKLNVDLELNIDLELEVRLDLSLNLELDEIEFEIRLRLIETSQILSRTRNSCNYAAILAYQTSYIGNCCKSASFFRKILDSSGKFLKFLHFYQ